MSEFENGYVDIGVDPLDTFPGDTHLADAVQLSDDEPDDIGLYAERGDQFPDIESSNDEYSQDDQPRFADLVQEKVDALASTRYQYTSELSTDIVAAQKELLGEIGLPEDLVSSISHGLTVRQTVELRYLANGIGYHNEYAAVRDDSRWRGVLERIHEQVSALGVEQFVRACEIGQYSCPDVFSVERLQCMANLAAGEVPPDDDITLLLVDIEGDHNYGVTEQVEEYENRAGNVYMVQMNGLSDIYRVPVTLAKRHGLVASTLAVLCHSDEDGMGTQQTEESITVKPHDSGEGWQFGQAQIGRFAHTYMKPSHVTGERTIVMGGCALADNREGYSSPIAAVSRRTNPEDRVVVAGSRAYVTSAVRLDTRDPEDAALIEDTFSHRGDVQRALGREFVTFWNAEEDMPALAYCYRNTPNGITRSVEIGIPGIQ